MIIYCMSDIHGCLAEFEDALSLVLDDIEQGKAKLVLLGVISMAVLITVVFWTG